MPVSRHAFALAATMLVAPAVLIAAARAGAGGAETKQPEAVQAPDRARVEELIRRTRHGAEMFLGVQDRAYALIQVAGVQARTGDREGARETFRQARQLAETVGFDDATYSPHILMWIIWAEQRLGFRDEAIAASRSLLRIAEAPTQRETAKASLYTNLVKTLAEMGDREGVQATLKAGRTYYTARLKDGSDDFAVVQLVSLQAASGDLAGALRMARDPALFKGRSPENATSLRQGALLGAVMRINVKNREDAGPLLKEALRFVNESRDRLPWRGLQNKNGCLQTIAEAQARIGQFDEALKSARMIDAETIPGHLAEARKADFLDHERFRKAQTFAAIGREQAQAGDRSGARRTAEEAARIGTAIRSAQYKYPIWQTAEVLAMADDVDGARRLADAMDPDQRVRLYDSIAAIRRERGDMAGVRAITQAALDHVRGRLEGVKVGLLDSGSAEGKRGHAMLQKLGLYQAQLGDRKAALETIKEINTSTPRLEALKNLATELATAGDLDGALEAVGEMNSPQSEAEALKVVAGAYSRREDSPAAR